MAPRLRPAAASALADRSYLRDVQYRTDANLAARQSIYACQQPAIDLAREVVRLAAPSGGERVIDVGCGNGAYLAELARRGQIGPVVGIDLSSGMLHAAHQRAPAAHLLNGDAAALPLCRGEADLTLAMHMLYHVPEPAVAVAELRRITRPGGRVVVGLNGRDHLRELRVLIDAALAELGHEVAMARSEVLRLEEGEALLASAFGSVSRHDFTSELVLLEPQPVLDYVRSSAVSHVVADPGQLAAAIARLLPLGNGQPFRVRTHSGCLIAT